VELGALSEEEVRAKLRLGAVGVVASGGKPLRWLRGAELFEWWKVEARPRLVEPERTRRYDVPLPGQRRGASWRTPAVGYRLEDFPGERCWSANEWRLADGSTAIVFEEDH
jgi:hypothetical protein